MDVIKNMDDMTKRNVLGAIILSLSLVIIGISTSYAFFENGVEELNKSNQDVSVSSGSLEMKFATERARFLDASAATLTTEAVVKEGENYSQFTIEVPSTSTIDSGGYTVYLTDINISKNFTQDDDLRWALYTGNTRVIGGNFKGVEVSEDNKADDIALISGNVSKNAPVTYQLYIWLEKKTTNQNHLLGGNISAKISFVGSSRLNSSTSSGS